MEFWITLLFAVPGTVASVLAVCDWFMARKEKKN
jgi:hypothetical protein